MKTMQDLLSRMRGSTPLPDVGWELRIIREQLIVLSHLDRKVNHIMATVEDVKAALAANESKEQTIIGLLQTEAQLQKDTLAQLKALQDAGTTDPAALQAVVDKMQSDGAAMDAAIASVSAPGGGTQPAAPGADGQPAPAG